ncbi:carboxysome shell carbonic anhydrase [Cyanobium sp. ATX 6A2]|uniref:carboxysome shell carbonic anhydrase n=1 Tax=Cyanobium sp. ATX 6A2 TaxID=2823700 RepID=UPI0020CD681A|nr:carboxysome shell carbonic anhydrase [Cyanobium sp. ATX 6A2]MCP9887782.1 carboxysome shell carbonic anhydrase [Cyanobium sp. ATX 6A2]
MTRRPAAATRPLAPTAPRRRPGAAAETNPAQASTDGAASLDGSADAPVLRGTRARAAYQQARSLSPLTPARNQPLRRARASRPQVNGIGARPPISRRDALGGEGREHHPLTNAAANAALRGYDEQVKHRFDRIVPVLKQIAALQHEDHFEERAQELARAELGHELPPPVLEAAWVSQLDMRTLFAWCVFEAYEHTSAEFFASDPLSGQPGREPADTFNAFLLSCGFHLLDITPCADGRLAHAIAYALRLPFSSVRRRPHAGALFDVETTVNRWVKTEHNRYREGVPNPAHEPTRYLKVVLYHFSSLDPSHEGCAAHGSDDTLAASCGLARLHDFQEAVENSFCCGASVDLLLMGIDTDTDAIRVHVPGMDGSTHLDRWLDAADVYDTTRGLDPDAARERIAAMVLENAAASPDPGMVKLVSRLLENNISQIDYVRRYHGGHYSDEGHAERFIGVGIGFKEIHLRNLTYFAYMDTVEEGAPDLDVGVKIFKGLNVTRGLPVPVVVRFDYHGQVPGARERAIRHCERVQAAIEIRYGDLFEQGLLHALLTVRDQDRHIPAETIGSTITFATGGGH